MRSTPALADSERPTPNTEATTIAIHMWNMMNGKIEWAALPVLCEIYWVGDIEQLIEDLVTIRDFK